MILKPMPFLLSHYNLMIVYSITCDFLLERAVTGPPDQTSKTLFRQTFVAVGLWNIVLGRGISFSCHLPFTFSPMKNTTEICSWNNSYISQLFAELVKEERKFRLGFTVSEWLCQPNGTPPPKADRVVKVPKPDFYPSLSDRCRGH